LCKPHVAINEVWVKCQKQTVTLRQNMISQIQHQPQLKHTKDAIDEKMAHETHKTNANQKTKNIQFICQKMTPEEH
jgi:hypothetical protein